MAALEVDFALSLLLLVTHNREKRRFIEWVIPICKDGLLCVGISLLSRLESVLTPS